MIEALPRERTKPKTTKKVEPPRAVSTDSSGTAFARFLELPPALVMAVMWLVGVALLGLCGLALYLAGTALTS
jgi:hypothetical protein